MNLHILTQINRVADVSAARSVMEAFVQPVMLTLIGLAALVCVFFLVNAGFHYMTSSGQPDKLEHAKRVLKNAIIGLVIVISAGTLTSILTHAYGSSNTGSAEHIPSLTAIEPNDDSGGIVGILVKAIVGLFKHIIVSAASPFIKALDYFTKGTPLMAENPAVFKLWLTLVGITDALFVLVVALLGFHVMSAATLGLDEIEFKHLLPQIALTFLLINTSIFAIDAIISLSNAMIHALTAAYGNVTVWDVLNSIASKAGGLGLVALMIMIVFLTLGVILLVYYVMRLVTLFLGAVLAPLVVLLWLVPAFKDFAITAIKTYITTIFVLFVHVVTLELAATLFVGLSATDGNNGLPNVLMSMVIGLATVLTLLKTQGVMMQFGYVSLGARNARKLGSQFMNGVSYLTGKGQAAVSSVSSKASSGAAATSSKSTRTTTQTNTGYKQPKNMNTQAKTSAKSKRPETGMTIEAPKVTPRSEATNAKLAKLKKEEK